MCNFTNKSYLTKIMLKYSSINLMWVKSSPNSLASLTTRLTPLILKSALRTVSLKITIFCPTAKFPSGHNDWPTKIRQFCSLAAMVIEDKVDVHVIETGVWRGGGILDARC